MIMKNLFYLISIFLVLLISCSVQKEVSETSSNLSEVPSIDYSQLKNWRSELRTEMLESRRNINLTNDLVVRSEIYVNETLDFYIWIKNNLAESYVDSTCDDDIFRKTIRSQLSPVELLIQISDPNDDPFELFPLPSEIIHILGSEGSVGLEKDSFELIDEKTLEWTVEFANEPLTLKKADVWYIIPTRLTEQIFKGCKK
tara:strand:+ start:5285 stop:5884 length:600 start_codon:yes stop_codon:yes gene_type:complete